MRILFVGMSASIHVVRWISQLSEQGWELHIFSSNNNIQIHPGFKNVTIYKPFYSYQHDLDKSVKIVGIPVLLNFFVKVGNKMLNTLIPDFNRIWLNYTISHLKPDIIHSMEFQAAGYLTLAAKKKSNKKFPVWIATNYGSDIYLFRHDPNHLIKIKDMLTNCDYYSCECQRDVEIAKELGLTGKILPVFPNAGGFDLDYLTQFRQKGLVSERKIILVKGYQGWAGRALIALSAIESCARDLQGYTIVVYSASGDVRKRVSDISLATDLTISVLEQVPYSKMMEFFGKSRIYIGLSISDGISTSLLEAMVMGAFPIQSDTSCADEWIGSGKSGIIVPPENEEAVADAIRIAINDDNLVNNAADINERTSKERLNRTIIKTKVQQFYMNIINPCNQ